MHDMWNTDTPHDNKVHEAKISMSHIFIQAQPQGYVSQWSVSTPYVKVWNPILKYQ